MYILGQKYTESHFSNIEQQLSFLIGNLCSPTTDWKAETEYQHSYPGCLQILSQVTSNNDNSCSTITQISGSTRTLLKTYTLQWMYPISWGCRGISPHIRWARRYADHP